LKQGNRLGSERWTLPRDSRRELHAGSKDKLDKRVRGVRGNWVVFGCGLGGRATFLSGLTVNT
jgi:hypothetical protein